MICCIDCNCQSFPQSADVVPFDDPVSSLVLISALTILFVMRIKGRNQVRQEGE